MLLQGREEDCSRSAFASTLGVHGGYATGKPAYLSGSPINSFLMPRAQVGSMVGLGWGGAISVRRSVEWPLGLTMPYPWKWGAVTSSAGGFVTPCSPTCRELSSERCSCVAKTQRAGALSRLKAAQSPGLPSAP